jgi:hypothetical protein
VNEYYFKSDFSQHAVGENQTPIKKALPIATSKKEFYDDSH